MEVVKRYLWRLWMVLGDFVEEITFRLTLAFKVLSGRVPISTEKRGYIRSIDKPVLIDAYDWTTDRCLFSVLVHPPLEVPWDEEEAAHFERVRQVKEVITSGAGKMGASLYLESDYGLEWDAKREVWTSEDGYPYDAKRFASGPKTSSPSMARRLKQGE
jgi:hypothetical protein